MWGYVLFQILQSAQQMLRATASKTLREKCSGNRACASVSCLYGSLKSNVMCLESKNDFAVNAVVYYFNLMSLYHSYVN